MTYRASRSNRFLHAFVILAVVALFVLCSARLAYCQSSSSPAASPAPATSPPPSTTAAPTSNSQAPLANPASTPAAPPKPKHVITNEDLEPKSSPASDKGKLVTTDNSPLLNCEHACEQEARQQLGYGPDQEAEWQLQIVQARRDLVADKDWRGQLGQSIQQLNTYCEFMIEGSQQVSPSGNDYHSRVARAKADNYFENMDRVLRQNLDATFNRLQNRVQEVAVLSPVRAALMYVQASRIIDRPCEAPSH
jgi:hypothetical protein